MADEKAREHIEACPFCSSLCFAEVYEWDQGEAIVSCGICSYQTRSYAATAEAIAAHNKIAKAAEFCDNYGTILTPENAVEGAMVSEHVEYCAYPLKWYENGDDSFWTYEISDNESYPIEVEEMSDWTIKLPAARAGELIDA